MYLEHFQLHTTPFREEVDSQVFFPEAKREAILQNLLQDIKSGKLFVKLIGAEGTGKTLMCKVLQEQLGDEFEIVYLDRPAGSFDDVLRIVCTDLGLQAVDEQVDLVEELKKQLQERKARGQKVLLVLDGAENIFLATLERLLRLLCEIDALADFTLMLAGRPALDNNLDQLTVYCTGVDIQAGYFLEPMNQEETGHYLIFRLLAAGLDADKQEDVFTGEAVEKLYIKAEGNPRLTSIFAEEALQKSCSEKSFLVLLDHVDPEEDLSGGKGGGFVDLLNIIRGKGKWAAIAAGLLLLAFLVFFLFPGTEEAKKKEIVQQQQDSAPIAVVPAVQENESLKPESEEIQDVVAEEIQDVAAPAVQKPEVQTQPAVISIEATEKKTLPPLEPVLSPKQEKTQAGEKNVTRKGEELFKERLRASAGWLAGAYRGEYTIQLMMLASEQAPANVQKILLQDEYVAIKDQLYILRKKTSPPTLFVFYGTFASMEDARHARNQMPIFLRKHHPYALSIADALTKTED
jgi:type II secretory pathway predicted ATPase ExeA